MADKKTAKPEPVTREEFNALKYRVEDRVHVLEARIRDLEHEVKRVEARIAR